MQFLHVGLSKYVLKNVLFRSTVCVCSSTLLGYIGVLCFFGGFFWESYFVLLQSAHELSVLAYKFQTFSEEQVLTILNTVQPVLSKHQRDNKNVLA